MILCSRQVLKIICKLMKIYKVNKVKVSLSQKFNFSSISERWINYYEAAVFETSWCNQISKNRHAWSPIDDTSFYHLIKGQIRITSPIKNTDSWRKDILPVYTEGVLANIGQLAYIDSKKNRWTNTAVKKFWLNNIYVLLNHNN
jgi:hypothetical protein